MSTVNDYLIAYIEARRITDPTRWVEPELAEKIAVVATYNDTGRLRPIYDALHGRVGYEAIKIVLACAGQAGGSSQRTRQHAGPQAPGNGVKNEWHGRI